MSRLPEVQDVLLHMKSALASLDSLGFMAAAACVCAAIHHVEDAQSNNFDANAGGIDFSELDAVLEIVKW